MKIINTNDLIDKSKLEYHFKVNAGPGAGKTYWLTNHIKNILLNSNRLKNCRKVACVTYTNVGVDSILSKLGNYSNQVEVSTIHSLLYKHIIKPYMSFIPKKYELNIDKINGPFETVVYPNYVFKWLANIQKKDNMINPNINQIKSDYYFKELVKWLENLYYYVDKNERIILTSKKRAKYFSKNTMNILKNHIFEYKKLYWKNGLLDYDDVLFFSYVLICEYPFILTILRAKFPYFFIDEFQDTSPLQTKIIKLLGKHETIIGVIGDRAQSIYGFQGTSIEQFDQFNLLKMKEYTIVENKRSTNYIIDLLNFIRKDINQRYYKNIKGNKPLIIVGNKFEAYKKVKSIVKNNKIVTLSRTNAEKNSIKENFDNMLKFKSIIRDYLTIDSSKRSIIIYNYINAINSVLNHNIKDALRYIKLIFKKDDFEKKLAIKILYILLNEKDNYINGCLMDFYNIVKNNIHSNISGFRNGKIKKFYEDTNFRDIMVNIKETDIISDHITIHNAKGIDFYNVLVIFDKEKYFEFIFNPNLDSSEEHRIYYVAFSRAKENLFINLPSLKKENILKIEKTNLFNITYI